jgi:hypothetical protein
MPRDSDRPRDDPHSIDAVLAIGDAACADEDAPRLAATAHLLALCVASADAIELLHIEEVARVDPACAIRLWQEARARVRAKLSANVPLGR